MHLALRQCSLFRKYHLMLPVAVNTSANKEHDLHANGIVYFFKRYHLAFKLVLHVRVVFVLFLTYLTIKLLHCHHAMTNEIFFLIPVLWGLFIRDIKSMCCYLVVNISNYFNVLQTSMPLNIPSLSFITCVLGHLFCRPFSGCKIEMDKLL